MMDRLLEKQQHSIQDVSAVTAQLFDLVQSHMSASEVERVQRALKIAQETCQGVIGTEQLPPLEHALTVAIILAQMHIDAVGVCAGLIFEAVDANLLSLERVKQELGPAPAYVIDSMLRLNILERKKQTVIEAAVNAQSGQQKGTRKGSEEREEKNSSASEENKKRRTRELQRHQQAETVRKMFVAMAEDPRVVLLKLAYRLSTLSLMCLPNYTGDLQERLTIAEESREIYAPLAGRLGMSRMESELEDLAFQILEPETYQWVRQVVEMENKQRRSYVERVCAILRQEMVAIGVQATVSGRVKHLYSFYKKLQRNAGDVGSLENLKKAADINQIHDVIAFRILVDTTPDCYLVLGHVHSLWKPKEGRIKDLIANPKPNGYSALHTTVFCLDDQLAEVQIRTHAMHEMAEYGVAMHWHYKDIGDTASASAKELLSWLRQLAEWQRDIRASNTTDTEFANAVKQDIFQEQIFVFTPKGEVKDLPVGSTPLDFAYRVHTKVGDHCAGARIITEIGRGDGERLVTRMVPLDYELKSGEIVDIVTTRSAHPTRDWLRFAHTAAAKSKIRRYLKTHERHINIQIGRERLDKALGARGLEAVNEEAENWLCGEYRVNSFEDLLASIGANNVRPHAVAVKLTEHWQQLREGKEPKDTKEKEEEPLTLPASTNKQLSSARLQVAGVSGLLTRLANCCCPLPSDEIVGFISRGRGVIVHRADCWNVSRYRQSDQERVIDVSWVSMSQPHYRAPVVIVAHDRPGLIRDIATVVSEIGVNMTTVTTHLNSKHEVFINATLEIDGVEQMYRLFAHLEKVRDVVHVERELGKWANAQSTKQ
ncbi:MAG: bifunctional (p)ppGpp synthetase/guanosine-3',5'-bis(diphosphate) 3'-pyrophosphohydrolase [Ktedonobacteraceae bacterium]|nr:bifunctional (p)ppGpp synthetase/guanosine-3',5'-bis(diphosphate) 3'-pyrophosphohydrolase [Ktedonobacteraceae bacterium]